MTWPPTRSCGGPSSARAPAGPSTSCTGWASWREVRRRSAGAKRPTATSRCCAPTTGSGTASTRSTSTRPGTRCSTWRSAPGWPAPAGPIRDRAPTLPALRSTPDLAAAYEPLLTSRAYDFGLRPPARKRGLLAGMGMTEKQGGSDVRTNTTTATPGPDGTWLLRGHKWFTSAPMCDLFLVLAQAPGGLSCFLVPRVLPDGTRNPFRIQRLKDKLGNRSNASAEVEFDATHGWLVGDEGAGV